MFTKEHFSFRVRNIRRQLWHDTADFRRNGSKVILRHDYGLVNNVRYTWDESNSCIVKAVRPVVSAPSD